MDNFPQSNMLRTAPRPAHFLGLILLLVVVIALAGCGGAGPIETPAGAGSAPTKVGRAAETTASEPSAEELATQEALLAGQDQTPDPAQMTEEAHAMETMLAEQNVTPDPAQMTEEAHAMETMVAMPTETPLAPTKTVKKGERVTVGGAAITVTKVELTDGPGAMKADPGNKWLVAHVDLENVGTDPLDIYYAQFEFMGKDGVLYDNLGNDQGDPTAFSPDSLDAFTLQPGDKATNKLVYIQIDPATAPGMGLIFLYDEQNVLKVDLGL